MLRVYAFTRTQGRTLTCARSEMADDPGRFGLSYMLMGPEHRLTMLGLVDSPKLTPSQGC